MKKYAHTLYPSVINSRELHGRKDANPQQVTGRETHCSVSSVRLPSEAHKLKKKSKKRVIKDCKHCASSP